jgi:hypothetical protein
MAARKNQRPNNKTNTPKVAAPKTAPPNPKTATPKPTQPIPGSWFEENWTSWLRPVVFIATAGLFLLLYSTGTIPDFWAAGMIMLALIGLIWFAAVSTETKRFPEEKRTAVYGLTALIALFAWVPVLFTFYPGEPRLMGDLKKKGDALDLAPLGNTQNYLIVAGGAFADNSESNREVDYLLEGFNDTKKVIMRGKVEQRMEQVKSRRGIPGQTLKTHSQDKSYLTLSSSKPLTLTTDISAQALPDGIHVAIYDPPLGGLWLLLGSLLFYLLLMGVDLKYVADKGKGYLAAGGGVLLVGSLVFCTNAVPYAPFTTTSDLAQTALGAAIVGGIFGSFGGLLLMFILGKLIKRPPLPDEFAAAKTEE